jgi:hypothetical protein
MPMLLGSATLVCTLLSIAAGEIAMGVQALGVMLAAAVLISLQRE